VALIIAFVVGLYQYAESREREYYFELWKEKKPGVAAASDES
jgi:hypothetical protein